MEQLPTFKEHCNLVYRFGTVIERAVINPCLAINSVVHAACCMLHAAPVVCVVMLFLEGLNPPIFVAQWRIENRHDVALELRRSE